MFPLPREPRGSHTQSQTDMVPETCAVEGYFLYNPVVLRVHVNLQEDISI